MVMTQYTTTQKELTTPDHPATIETTVTTVQVLCPSCITPKDSDMTMLWRRDGQNRFRNVKCISCPFKRIGHWFLRQQTEMHSITEWLQTHSYDGKSFLEHKSKPPTATLELFTGQNASTALAETSTQSTNKKEDLDDHSQREQHTPSKATA